MTIDEAQIMLKAKAKCIERICKGIYEDCNEQKCDNCDSCYAQGTNGEQIELMLQCAEWLEELKAIKSDGFTDDLLNMGFTKGYNKAIDEAMISSAKAICIGCGYLKGTQCTYKGCNCGVSKPMLESVMKALEQLKSGAD